MDISIKVTDNFRKFEKGSKIKLEIPTGGILYIAGKNGCGKSTILQMLRNKKDSLKEYNRNNFDGMEDSRIELSGLGPFEVEGFEYDECFYLDALVDDPNSFINAASAGAFIGGGGFYMQNMSKGEKSLRMIDKFLRMIKKSIETKYGTVEEWKNSGKTGLIVFDEADEGLDTMLQLRWNKLLKKAFSDEFGCDIICVTHNPLCMLSPSDDTTIRVMDITIPFITTLSPQDYFVLFTGYKIDITKKIKDIEEQ